MVEDIIKVVHGREAGSCKNEQRQLRRGSYLILFLSLLFLASCGQGQEVRSINKVYDRLYLVINDWTIKAYDVPRGRWQKTVRIPGRTSDRGRYSGVSKVLMDNGSHLIQIETNAYNVYDESDLFLVKEGEVKRLGRLPYHAELLAVDEQFLYFAQIKWTQTRPKEAQFHAIPFRYDKQMRERKELHFEAYPDLVVADICQSGDHYWYACINGAVGQNIHVGGPLVLLSRPNHVDTFERFDLEEYEVRLNNITLASDGEYIWVLEKSSYGRREFPRFTKALKEFVVLKIKDPSHSISGAYRILAERETTEKGGAFWLVFGKDLFRLSKETFEIQPVPLPDEINLHQNYPLRPVFSDDKNLWITLVSSHKNIGWETEHLLRISKADLNWELIPIDRLAIISHLILDAAVSIWPAYVVLAVGLLVVGVVLGMADIRAMKEMKGRKVGAWFSIASILAIVCSPLYKNVFEYFLIPVFLLMSTTMILLSRSLAHCVKQMRYKLFSWLLTFVFSAGSGLLFFVLFLLAFRFISGERGIGLLLFTFPAAIAVGVVSLVVNIAGRIIRPKRKTTRHPLI